MGRFTFNRDRVLDAALPMGARFNAFIQCCSAFASLARRQPGDIRMQEVYDRLGEQLGFDQIAKPNEQQLCQSVAILERARHRLLLERERFESERKKIKGEQKKSAVEKLYAGIDPLVLLSRK